MPTTFWRQAYLSYKGLFTWLNWHGYVSSIFLRPAFMVGIFGLTGRFARGEAASEAYVVGMTAFAVPHLLMGGVLQSFAYERSFATLGFLFTSTGSRAQAFLARGLLHYPNAVLTVISSLLFAVLFLGSDFSAANWPAAVACYALIIASTLMFGLFVGNFCIAFRDWQVTFNVMQAAFITLTGAVIPLQALPPGLRQLAAMLPVTHGLEALRGAFAGQDLAQVSDALLAEAGLGLAYGLAGYFLFRAVEAYARRTGAYEMTR
jgi:ABC-2 type transport system permease protein